MSIGVGRAHLICEIDSFPLVTCRKLKWEIIVVKIGEKGDFMLVAHDENQQLIILQRQFSRDELQVLKKQHQFFCPQCNEPLQLKITKFEFPILRICSIVNVTIYFQSVNQRRIY